MKYITPKELYEWGLLFEINRRVLHPLGMALAVEMDEEENAVFSNDVWDCRDDPEGFIFEEKTFIAGQEKYQKFLDEQGNDILKSRRINLGFIEQEKGDSDED